MTKTLFCRCFRHFPGSGIWRYSARHLVLISQKVSENRILHTVTSWKTGEFYSVFQWKSSRVLLFWRKAGIPAFLSESNLFKGLF